MSKVFIGVGANLGDPKETIAKAKELLLQEPAITDFVSSRLYLTVPISDIPQSDYINCVWSFSTQLSPRELFEILQDIEKKLGKIDKPKNAPRLIDLDILLYGEINYNGHELTIPHPRWKERGFVLIPLAELAETIKVAEGKELNIKELIAHLPDTDIKGVVLVD